MWKSPEICNICNKIIEIDNQSTYTYNGKYAYYLEKRAERIEAQNSEIAKARNLYRTELDWMRRQPQARATKAKYRIDAFYDIKDKAHQHYDNSKVNLNVKSSYIGSKIFVAHNVCKAFGDKKILDDFNYTFARYEKLGIIGNNGAGKSSFVKLLLNEYVPDSGYFEIGETVKFGYYSREGIKFNIDPHPDDFVENGVEAWRVIRGLNSKQVGFVYVAPHSFHMGDQASEILNAVGDRLGAVYLSDTFDHHKSHGLRYITNPPGNAVRVHQHLKIGDGDVNFEEIFSLLRSTGYLDREEALLVSNVFAEDEAAEEVSRYQLDKIRSLIDAS